MLKTLSNLVKLVRHPSPEVGRTPHVVVHAENKWRLLRFSAPSGRPPSRRLPLLLVPNLPAILAGLVLVAVGTFFAQAAATSYVGRTARSDRAAASGLYLSSYYCGGLAGAVVFGVVYDRAGWEAAVAGLGLATLAGIGLGLLMRDRS